MLNDPMPFVPLTMAKRGKQVDYEAKAVMPRKNALFADHDDGAENWAILASLIETAKLSGIDPQAWLTDVLTRLVNLWPNNHLDELLPWTWAEAHQPQRRAA